MRALLLEWFEVRGESKQYEGLLELFSELEGSEPALALLADGRELVGSGISRCVAGEKPAQELLGQLVP